MLRVVNGFAIIEPALTRSNAFSFKRSGSPWQWSSRKRPWTMREGSYLDDGFGGEDTRRTT